ncbi:hypothetical protein H4696_003395 [Amycolatopsis lexingtonensis]|uniref:Uncharacterized protein n=1 Tax=Amycolatopsis lexingtonensis TaxID=218822 RepID=A0ABR9HZF7_9PSEU|nr:hypothetical protein [Amycolatopsis lexingtonensis]MBE1496295.1 hypothetical protein [Amycolatopsis lexingtonensis]
MTADPCAAVTLDQLHDIEFTGGHQQAGSDRRCTARFDATTVSVWIDGATLAYLYTERARGHSGSGNHFDPITIDTYPAVIISVADFLAPPARTPTPAPSPWTSATTPLSTSPSTSTTPAPTPPTPGKTTPAARRRRSQLWSSPISPDETALRGNTSGYHPTKQ